MGDYIEPLTRRNPKLLQAAVQLHQAGEIPPTTFVLDIDTIRKNAEVLNKEAQKHHISVYYITKQVARNPLFAHTLVQVGLDKSVAIDIEEAKSLYRNGLKVSHLGQLDQVPTKDIEFVLSKLHPEVISVWNIEKAEQIGKVARKLGVRQGLLLRVLGPGNYFYPVMDGGFREEEVISAAKRIGEIGGVRVAGLTTYPAFSFRLDSAHEEPIPNFFAMKRVEKRLKKELGIEIEQINAPGDNQTADMAMYGEVGATHVEPGHAFTGTLPRGNLEDIPEVPACVYVTEVSHHAGNRAFAFGGGTHFIDRQLVMYGYTAPLMRALAGSNPTKILDQRVFWELPTAMSWIDYYTALDPVETYMPKVGDSVLMSFRMQAWATRSKIAVVKGIGRRNPKVLGLFDRCGNLLGEYEKPMPKEAIGELVKML